MHHAYIDKFAYQDSFIHQLDSRVKFIVLLVFTAVVISLPRTSFSILVCFAAGPFTVLVLGGIPLRFALRQILLASPFVLVLALSCPYYDRTDVTTAFGPFVWQMAQGWVRCFVIVGKFVVTMLALIALVSTTRFADLLTGLGRLGVPKLLIIQLGLLYRYIFVLIERGQLILRARAARALRNLGLKEEIKTAGCMVGSLLLRSIDDAEHIHTAMQARGFCGKWRSIAKHRMGRGDLLFFLISAGFMAAVYFFVRPVLQ
jgi:cobalt/nickel transport system permease protein